MPFYDFQCEKCDHVFEIRASIHEKEIGLEPECPECHGLKTRQIITASWGVSNGKGSIRSVSSGCGPDAGPGCCG